MAENKKCTWNPEEHKGKSCPHHEGGGADDFDNDFEEEFKESLSDKEAEMRLAEEDEAKSPYNEFEEVNDVDLEDASGFIKPAKKDTTERNNYFDEETEESFSNKLKNYLNKLQSSDKFDRTKVYDRVRSLLKYNLEDIEDNFNNSSIDQNKTRDFYKNHLNAVKNFKSELGKYPNIDINTLGKDINSYINKVSSIVNSPKMELTETHKNKIKDAIKNNDYESYTKLINSLPSDVKEQAQKYMFSLLNN